MTADRSGPSDLSGGLQLPAQEQEGSNSQHHKNDDQRHNVEREVSVQHVELLERGRGRLEMTVHLVTLELFATVRVGGQSSSLKTVTNVG